MGVFQIKMVTGDALAIAKETAKSTGAGQQLFSMAASRAMSSSKKTTAAAKPSSKAPPPRPDGFRPSGFPEHKFHM